MAAMPGDMPAAVPDMPEPEPEPEPFPASSSMAIVPFSEKMLFTNPRLLPVRRFAIHDQEILIEQRHQTDAMACDWDAGGSLTGAAVWDAALVLAHYLPQVMAAEGGSSVAVKEVVGSKSCATTSCFVSAMDESDAVQARTSTTGPYSTLGALTRRGALAQKLVRLTANSTNERAGG